MKFETYTDEKPTLEEAQKFVGGYIELISLKNGDQLIVNEEGKLKGLHVNPEATTLFQDDYGMIDVIVGDVLRLRGKARLD